MKIVSSKRINFLISNIFERYYEPIMEELYYSGLAEELVQKVIQEIVISIYRKAMEKEVEIQEELDLLAEPIINERLERVLILHYAKKYIDKFPIDKVSLEEGMLKKTKEIHQNECKENLEKQIVEQPIKESVEQSIKETAETLEEELVEQSVKEMAETLEEEPVEEPILYMVTENGLEKEEQETTMDEIVKSEDENKMRPYHDYDDAEEVEIIDLANERRDVPVIRRMEEPRIRRGSINWGLTFLVSVVVTVFLWFMIGILMGRGYLPRVDIGYTWFNSHIWSVF